MIYLGCDTYGIIKTSYINDKKLKCVLIFNNISLNVYKNIIFHYINYVYQHNKAVIDTYILIPVLTKEIYKISNLLDLYNFVLNINNTGKISYDVLLNICKYKDDMRIVIFDDNCNDNINDYKQIQNISQHIWIYNNKVTDNKIIKVDYDNLEKIFFNNNIFNLLSITEQLNINENKVFEDDNIIIYKNKQTYILNLHNILNLVSYICYTNISNTVLKHIISYCIKNVKMNYEKVHIFKCYEYNIKHVLCNNVELTLSVEHILKQLVLKANYNCHVNYDVNNILIKDKLTDKLLKQINDIDDDATSIQKSCEFFTSVLTLSNWVDELRNYNIMCMLANISTKDTIRKDIILHSPNIKTISTYFFPLNEYLTMLNNKTTDNLCINKIKIITDTTIGTYNIVIPIYINKLHWTVTKIYLNALLGINYGDNPLINSKKYHNILFTFLMKFTGDMIINNNIIISDQLIRCYITLLRTCFEIAIENKYCRGIGNYINYLITEFYSKNVIFDINIVLGQIIATCYNGDNITDLIICINRMAIKYHSNDINKINIIIQYFTKMHTIILKLRTLYGSYNKFIKELDNNHGYLPDNITDTLSKLIKETQIK